ncbi:MAG: transposase [Myxococcota bacterium]
MAVVQRSSGDLKLNPHVHAILLDGVFVADAAGTPRFCPVERFDTTATADILQIVRARILRFLVRRRIVESPVRRAHRLIDDDLAEREPALPQLARAAVSGLPPAGPEIRRSRRSGA